MFRLYNKLAFITGGASGIGEATARRLAAAGIRSTSPGRRRAHEPNALRKRFRKALMRQSGAVGVGRIPATQPQPAIWRITAGSWAMIEIGTS